MPALAHIGRITGRTFGDRDNPLLVSVRSGARASMPGMMDTVLNLGLNDETVEALAQQSGDRRFAYDSYRRFIQMYSDVVLGVEHHHFEDILEDHKDAARLHARHRPRPPTTGSTWSRATRSASRRSTASRSRRTRAQQLWGAIGAVFGSWMNAARHHLPPPARHPRKAGAPRSTSRPWCSATWATPRPPASPSPAIRRPARSGSTASS